MFAFVLLLPTVAWAAKHEGVSMRDTASVGEAKLSLVGMSLKEATVFKVDVFVAGLYTETPPKHPQTLIECGQTQRLLLEFKRGIDDGVLGERWSEELEDRAEEDAAFDAKKLHDRIMKIGKLIPDVEKKDRLQFTYVPSKGLEIEHNGKVRGSIPGRDFCAVFFDGFFGPESDKKMRRELLARKK
jgi:hypothetical protein